MESMKEGLLFFSVSTFLVWVGFLLLFYLFDFHFDFLFILP